MNWLFIAVGLIALAICVFVVIAATRAHVWYKHYSNKTPLPTTEVPSDLWIIVIGIASILSISLFALVPILGTLFAFVAGIVLLALFSTFKREGKQNAFFPVMYWSVGLGALLSAVGAFVLFIYGFFAPSTTKLIESRNNTTGLINI